MNNNKMTQTQDATENKELDDKDLKLEAYRQKVAELTEQVMELRVQITRLVEALKKAQDASQKEDATAE